MPRTSSSTLYNNCPVHLHLHTIEFYILLHGGWLLGSRVKAKKTRGLNGIKVHCGPVVYNILHYITKTMELLLLDCLGDEEKKLATKKDRLQI